jgi:geranylgeranyl diphosphate synthase type II
MDLNAYLQEGKGAVDLALDRYLPPTSEPPGLVHEAMRYSTLDGGKRIRPILTLAACETVGGPIETAMPAACAIECIHTFSLIHDDLPCMDDDDYRRGRPTSHRVYGEAMALLAGDALFAFAFQLISQIRDASPQAIVAVCRILSAATGTGGMVGGQVFDMLAQGSAANLEEVEQIHRLKTGALLEASVIVGAVLGGGSEEQVEALSDYGRNIGLAFQIADDVLDLRGDSEKLGKTAGSDLRMQKATYPSVIGIEASVELANRAMNQAIDSLSIFDNKAEQLRQIARFIVERET